jgi:hypothetical protein
METRESENSSINLRKVDCKLRITRFCRMPHFQRICSFLKLKGVDRQGLINFSRFWYAACDRSSSNTP